MQSASKRLLSGVRVLWRQSEMVRQQSREHCCVLSLLVVGQRKTSMGFVAIPSRVSSNIKEVTSSS